MKSLKLNLRKWEDLFRQKAQQLEAEMANFQRAAQVNGGSMGSAKNMQSYNKDNKRYLQKENKF